MRFYIRLSTVVLLLAQFSACADRAIEVGPPVAWGAADHVVQAGNLYFADQPDQQTLEMAQAEGIDLVVNLRLPEELEWDEASAAGELGMQYLQVPVSKTGPGFDQTAIESLHELAAGNPGRQILLHCSSGNRASAWYAIYLVEKLGYSREQAVAIAQQTGLTKQELRARIDDYLDRK